MFKQKQRKTFGHFRHNGKRGARGNFGGHRKPKSLDPRFFVQKASDMTAAEEYVPKHSFSDFLIASEIRKNIEDHGYKTPTPIQDQTIPLLLEGRDVVGIASTGTGKTAAFLVPLINKVFRDKSQRVLVVAPTRELAVQIENEFRAFSKGLNIYSALCIGGVKMNPQIFALSRRPSFVIGTPGRIKDLENQGRIHFETFRNIVLDEVDRMLDMGFIKDVQYIISRLSQNRQSLFFSATMPDSVKSIMNGFLKNPVTVSVKTQAASANVDQDVVRINGREKIHVLFELLDQPEFSKVLVFGRTKWGTEKVARALIQKGFLAAAIHGNKSQSQRQTAIEKFKKNRVQVLVATDVASRGLDIDDVTHVINFDQPESYEDYIHRIGRTGRAGKKGKALTFIA